MSPSRVLWGHPGFPVTEPWGWDAALAVPSPATRGCSPGAGAGAAGGLSWASGGAPRPGWHDTAALSGPGGGHRCRPQGGRGHTEPGTGRGEGTRWGRGLWRLAPAVSPSSSCARRSGRKSLEAWRWSWAPGCSPGAGEQSAGCQQLQAPARAEPAHWGTRPLPEANYQAGLPRASTHLVDVAQAEVQGHLLGRVLLFQPAQAGLTFK